MTYTASSLALAAIESFVHFSSALLPADYVFVAIEIPDPLAVETWSRVDVPPDWARTPGPSALQEMGKEWAASKRTAVLSVPSAVIEHESIVLINPAHPDAALIQPRRPEPFIFDRRLIKAPRQAAVPGRKRKA